MRKITRPNVLIIYTDQQRQDSLGCYGNKLAKTPNLDKLSAEGCRFDNFFVNNPVCSPSRMSFLSGRYPSSVGIGINGITFPDNVMSVNQLLKPYGYYTAQIGKLHFEPHSRRNHRDPAKNFGFDTFILSDEPGSYDDAYLKWIESIDPSMVDFSRTPPSLPEVSAEYGEPNRSTRSRSLSKVYAFDADEDLTHSAFVASETCRFLEQKRDQPFFTIAGFYAPHPPLNPPQRFIDMYDVADVTLPQLSEEEKKNSNIQNMSEQQIKNAIVHYMAMVSHVDDCVGKILETLKETGQEENTLVIFTTDHGEYLGGHGKFGKSMPGYHTIVRVPCLIKYPGKIPAGTSTVEMVEAVDVVPTILDYCGVQIPRAVQGISLRSLLEGKTDKHKDDIIIESFTPHKNRNSTVRTKEYMYNCDMQGHELLFDFINDPNELYNIADDPKYSEALSDMRKRLIIRMHKAQFNCQDRPAHY